MFFCCLPTISAKKYLQVNKNVIYLQCTITVVHCKGKINVLVCMIKITDLAFSYGKFQVLRNISLTLEPGKIYGLLGENGVGKTTLLGLISGLKKTQSGSIDADGHDPYKREPDFLADLYYLPDDVAPEYMKAIVWAENKSCFWPDFSLGRFKEIMQLFEVDINQKMNTMSCGQLKKTHIAFALACATKYLLMDEPTNGLDIPSKASFRSALMKYTSEESIILISTHQVRDLENVIDPIIILDNQNVLLNASLSEISDKLYFDYGNVLSPDALYSENLPGGHIQVLLNTTKEDSKVSIEALFNAVYKNKELLKNLFRHE